MYQIVYRRRNGQDEGNQKKCLKIVVKYDVNHENSYLRHPRTYPKVKQFNITISWDPSFTTGAPYRNFVHSHLLTDLMCAASS